MSEFWVELSIVAVADKKRLDTHWVSVQRDITERKQVEAALLRAAVVEATNQNWKEIIERKRSTITHNAFSRCADGLAKSGLVRIGWGMRVRTKQRNNCLLAVLFLDVDRFRSSTTASVT